MTFPVQKMLAIPFFSMTAMSLVAADKPLNIEKSFKASVANYGKSYAQYYQISNFKKEVVLENTDRHYVLLASYNVTIKPSVAFASIKVKEEMKYEPEGFRRELLVFKKEAGKWKIVDHSSQQNNNRNLKREVAKPKYNVKLIVHSGFWQVKFLEGKYKKYTAYSILNADPKVIRHPKRASAINSIVGNGGSPPPCSNSPHSKNIQVVKYKKQLPIVLPEAKSIRLLVSSAQLIYGLDIVKPRMQASGIPGLIHPVTIKANGPRTYRAYYYRICGKDVEYGILPIKIVSKAEFERRVQKSGVVTR